MADDYVSAEGLVPKAENPFLAPLLKSGLVGSKAQIVKGKEGWASKAAMMVDPETGEVLSDTLCLATKTRTDRGQFVKVFVAGLQATFDLSRRARFALTALLQSVNADQTAGPNKRNDMVLFSQTVAADWGWEPSRAVFRSAMNELCHKQFLCPVVGARDWYWTNPTFFHKGDRLVVVNHYVTGDAATAIPVKSSEAPEGAQLDFNDLADQGSV